MKIVDYFAQMRFIVDKNSVKQFDATLARAEKKLTDFVNKSKPINLKIGSFDVNQQTLNRVLGNALDVASTKVAFEISKFVVHDRNLQAALLRAARRLPGGPNGPNPPYPPHPPHPPHPGPYPPYPPYPRPPGAGGNNSFYGGGLARLYGPALALGAGGYGLSQLNKKNQEVVSAELQAEAVVQQAGGTRQQGKDSFAWLKQQAERVGFNYLDASADYNKLLSGLTGAGMSVQQGQGVYKGFAELSRVNKLDRVQQQRVFRALSQIAGKNQLMS